MAQIHKQLSESYNAVEVGEGQAVSDDDLDDRSDLENCALDEESSFLIPPVTTGTNTVVITANEVHGEAYPDASESTTSRSVSGQLKSTCSEDWKGQDAATNCANSDKPIIRQKEVVLSLFDDHEHKYLEPGLNVYAESRRLPESVIIRCSGTFTVWVNDDNKIDQYAFIYTAMDEEKT